MSRRLILTSVLAVLLAVVTSCRDATTAYDVILKSGKIIDGTGNPPYYADIGIRKGRIARIGKIEDNARGRIIDASNLCIAPGFIDVHTHTDRRIAAHPNAKNYLLQGVTTIVGGNCGSSQYPLKELFDLLKKQGIAVNFASFVGHNTVRRHVMGTDNRDPTEEELDQMQELVKEEMLAGAVGLSTGLEYIPGRFSSTEEIVALAKMIHPFNGVYTSHLREQGEYIRDAIEEAVRIGREAEVKVQISHVKLKIEKSWGKRHLITAPIHSAQLQGLEVYMDEYPYTAGSTGFTSSFPEWAVTGGHEAFVERLQDPAKYARIKEAIIDARFVSTRGIDKAKAIYVIRNKNHAEYEGKNLAEILEVLGRDNTVSNAADLFIELQRDDRPGAIFFQTDETDVIALMREPYAMVASDGGIQLPGEEVTHPRAYGTYPRVLARYVRELGQIPLPDAIRKMTSLPAQAMGFYERGVLKAGMWADIVIFDVDKILDKATYDEPHQYPEGIHWVLVNGKVAAHNGEIVTDNGGDVLWGAGKLK